jgi:hypothetical protein
MRRTVTSAHARAVCTRWEGPRVSAVRWRRRSAGTTRAIRAEALQLRTGGPQRGCMSETRRCRRALRASRSPLLNCASLMVCTRASRSPNCSWPSVARRKLTEPSPDCRPSQHRHDLGRQDRARAVHAIGEEACEASAKHRVMTVVGHDDDGSIGGIVLFIHGLHRPENQGHGLPACRNNHRHERLVARHSGAHRSAQAVH